MLFKNAPASIDRYNRLCLHYNLVADAIYQELRRTRAPFALEYERYLIAGLLAFDMGRGGMMGKSLCKRYDPTKRGFANRLHSRLHQIKPLLDKIISSTLIEIDLKQRGKEIKKAYEILSKPGLNARDNNKFDVGATKILHFLNPELFLIVDKNAAKAIKKKCGIKSQRYSAGQYLESLKAVKSAITKYDVKCFRALEPGTPLTRIFDKIAFACSAL